MRTRAKPILAFATQGAGGSDEDRLRALLANFQIALFPFDRKSKPRMFLDLINVMRKRHAELAVMEGTGVAGGTALIVGRLLFGLRYIVSSGDAVAPFLASRLPWFAPIYTAYERILYSLSDGFVGWTPYLVGRAITMGAPRGVTAPGWAPYQINRERRESARREVRGRLGIPRGSIVIGIAGSLVWNRRVGYCYGYELVEALRNADGLGVHAIIVGDGSGLSKLRSRAAQDDGVRVHFVGRVPPSKVPDYLSAMDLASLPQSVDKVGSFRYSTKLSEYLAAGLPVVTGQLPFAYDLDCGWLWRIPGSPWSPVYSTALGRLLTGLTPAQILERSCLAQEASKRFNRDAQTARVTAFISEILEGIAA